MSWVARYRREAVTIDVSGNAGDDLVWLDEFLASWREAAPIGRADLSVRMVRFDKHVSALQDEWSRCRHTAAAIQPAPCIRLDTRTVHFAGWSADGCLRLIDPVTGCFFTVSRGHVEVAAAPGNNHARLGLLGLVREAMSGALAAAQPVVDLHAAAFAIGGRAVVLAGSKGSGKTSLLCHAIVSGGASLVANDRVFVRFDTRPLEAMGIPTVISVRPATCASFPPVLGRADMFPALTPILRPAPPAGEPALQAAGESPVLLTPARFAGRLGAARVDRAPLHAVVLPSIGNDTLGWTLERLSPREAAIQLDASVYGVAADRETPTLFGTLTSSGAHGPAPIAGRLEQLAASVPVYRCRLAPDAYEWPAARLLKALELEV